MIFKNLIKWSETHFSQLPWRVERTLYGTLVSEIMLQQTTVGTVLNHYVKFIKKYPTLESLAQATEEELTISWKGLGYYRRARNLKKAAEYITHELDGKFPKDYDHLLKIPGIGDYTANALLSIGMNKRALALDANLDRVLARFFALKNYSKLEVKELLSQNKIFKNIKDKDFGKLNEALMDLGRTFCQANKVQCSLCPLNKECKSYKENSIVLNKDKKIKKKFYELKLLRCLVIEKNKILVLKKEKGQWLEGQYEVPTFILSSEDKKLDQYPKVQFQKTKIVFKSNITKYKIENFVVKLSLKDFKKQFKLVTKTEFKELNFDSMNFATSVPKTLRAYKNQEKV